MRVPWSQSEQPPPQVKRAFASSTRVVSRSMRHLFPAPPQPCVELQMNWSFFSTCAARKRRPSSAGKVASGSSSSARSAMPMAPMSPGFGGTITSAPVCRATAAASASDANGMP